jgi:hypothetical protein
LPAVSKTSDETLETRVTGTLHLGSIPLLPPQPPGSIDQSGPQPNETGYWLKSDTLLYVLKGSKSEASTNVVVLRVPAELIEKTRKLAGRHVVAVGLMNCTGNWAVGAHCNMLVKQIENVE